MKLFFRNLFKFIPLAAISYVLILIVWRNSVPAVFRSNLNYKGSPGHMFTRLQEVKNRRNVDVLILGSSHAFRGFDPRIFPGNGISSFNIGSSAQTPLQTSLLLERYLNQLNPKVIIYEVFPLIFNLDGVESAIDIIANDKNDLNSLEMAIALNNVKVYNTWIVSSLNEILNLERDFKESLIKGADTYIADGFVETKMRHFKPRTFPSTNLVLDANQISKFSEIMTLLKSKGITVILVFAPISPSLYKSYQNVELFDSTMMKFSTYYNFNKMLSLDDSTYFYDSHHLNQKGVEIFNKKLREALDCKYTSLRN